MDYRLFEKCFKKTNDIEGGYTLTNDPVDLGRMTYSGISRRAWPDWTGWQLIDGGEITGQRVEAMAMDFYQANFWNAAGCNKIASPVAACAVYDFAVNAGVEASVKIAQEIIGSYPDGITGPDTIKAFERFIHSDDTEALFMAKFSLQRIFKYKDICQADKRRKKDKYYSNMKYLCGWINRVERTLQ